MYYKINGVKMPAFSSFSFESNHLYGENTGRDEAGYNHLDLVRAGVRKWIVKHTNITRGEVRTIKQAVGALSFTMEALTDEGYTTANCYAKINKMDCKSFFEDSDEGSFWDLEISIIEM